MGAVGVTGDRSRWGNGVQENGWAKQIRYLPRPAHLQGGIDRAFATQSPELEAPG